MHKSLLKLTAAAGARFVAWNAPVDARHSSQLASSLGPLLVANRGEIACRVIQTAQKLGVPTVAVYSEADKNAHHVKMADQAVYIGPAAPTESYLSIPAILEAASKTGTASVHPGYGFLSENELFVQAIKDAGITFVGPPVEAIQAMGNKSNSKDIMINAGLQVVPGYHGPPLTLEKYQEEARRIGYPILIKAVLGGGGKGMKIATSEAELQEAIESAIREAKTAFSDDKILLERLVTQPRHVEVQIMADNHGNCVHVFERDCSVQRRHQKVLEEAPAPGFSDAQRMELGEAAVAAAKAVGYSGAGTVEFLLDAATGEAFFMEMNTRLQVEHPVSEMISGLDLVELQLRVAAGEALPLTQADLKLQGHAVEARIYSEEPQNNFLPAGGTVQHLKAPPNSQQYVNCFDTPRWDSAVQVGDTVGVHYDPLIGKLITHGHDRDEAMQKLLEALEGLQIAGLPTNIEFLKRVVAHPVFLQGGFTTAFLKEHADAVLMEDSESPEAQRALQLAVLAHVVASSRSAAAIVQDGSPWGIRDGFRVWGEQPYVVGVKAGPQSPEITDVHVTWKGQDCFELGTGSQHLVNAERVQLDGGKLLGWLDGRRAECDVCIEDTVRQATCVDLWSEGRHYQFKFPHQRWDESGAGVSGVQGNVLVAPMTAKVTKVNAEVGSTVKKDSVVVVVEAMKMEHAVKAPFDSIVEEVLIVEGKVVQDSQPLIRLSAKEEYCTSV